MLIIKASTLVFWCVGLHFAVSVGLPQGVSLVFGGMRMFSFGAWRAGSVPLCPSVHHFREQQDSWIHPPANRMVPAAPPPITAYEAKPPDP